MLRFSEKLLKTFPVYEEVEGLQILPRTGEFADRLPRGQEELVAVAGKNGVVRVFAISRQVGCHNRMLGENAGGASVVRLRPIVVAWCLRRRGATDWCDLSTAKLVHVSAFRMAAYTCTPCLALPRGGRGLRDELGLFVCSVILLAKSPQYPNIPRKTRHAGAQGVEKYRMNLREGSSLGNSRSKSGNTRT